MHTVGSDRRRTKSLNLRDLKRRNPINLLGHEAIEFRRMVEQDDGYRVSLTTVVLRVVDKV